MTDQSTALATREHDGEEMIEHAGGRERQPPATLARPRQQAVASIRQSEDVSLLMPAFALAQMAFPPIAKNRPAKIEGRGASYTYMYANLADVQAVVYPVLKEYRLAFMMVPTGSRLIGRLVHESGQFVEGDLPIVAPDSRGGMQALGSALTYLKRYLMSAMLGLTLDDFDDDGATAQAYTPAAAADSGAHTGHRAKAPPATKAQERAPTAKELGEAIDLAPTTEACREACERAIRLAPQSPKLRAHAFAKLIAMAPTVGAIKGIVGRLGSDLGLARTTLDALVHAADERAAALADAAPAEQPVSDDYADPDDVARSVGADQ